MKIDGKKESYLAYFPAFVVLVLCVVAGSLSHWALTINEQQLSTQVRGLPPSRPHGPSAYLAEHVHVMAALAAIMTCNNTR